jgi:hypothetical protein
MMGSIARLVFVLCVGASVAAQTPGLLQVSRQAQKAYAEKNYSDYLRLMKQAESIAPNNPAVAWHLARGHARAGDVAAAIAALNRVADLEAYYDANSSPDLAPLKDLPAFKQVLDRFAKLLTRIGSSEVALRAPGSGVDPESLAYDPRDRGFVMMGSGKIIKVMPDASVKTFPLEKDRIWMVLGIKLDDKRREIWANSCHFPPAPGGTSDFDPATVGSASVIRFDADSFKVIAKYQVADPKAPGCVNDVVIDRKGDAYVTMTPDGKSSYILKVIRATGKVERFLTPDDSYLGNGLVLTPDEQTMYLADSGRGIIRVDMKTRQWRLLDMPSNVSLVTIDGMYVHEGNLIVVQNGGSQVRVARVRLTTNGRGVASVETLERNHPAFGYPLTGVIVNGALYYSVSPRKEDEKAIKEPTILKLRL